ncbi:MAG: hypothetical protein HC769_28860 [Cyanobacteria bacterium CRU_2_1]|nr:hypothetical protein [Cyanobacteria bacterium RU_5_0]NJR62464.1 hypothetical protein [Cyanobacteria bacterium CRU_2_1]
MCNTYRPWAIVAAFPGHKPKIIARIQNRADADAHVRFLQQHIPQGEFYVVFEPEADQSSEVNSVPH